MKNLMIAVCGLMLAVLLSLKGGQFADSVEDD